MIAHGPEFRATLACEEPVAFACCAELPGVGLGSTATFRCQFTSAAPLLRMLRWAAEALSAVAVQCSATAPAGDESYVVKVDTWFRKFIF